MFITEKRLRHDNHNEDNTADPLSSSPFKSATSTRPAFPASETVSSPSNERTSRQSPHSVHSPQNADSDAKDTKTEGGNTPSRSASPDDKTKEYLFPQTQKDNVKAPNVTVIHPSAHHPFFGGRIPGATLPQPFAAPSSLARQHEEFLRHSLAASSMQFGAPKVSAAASLDTRFGSHPGLDSAAQLSHAHAHQMWLQNYYAALQHLHHRSNVPQPTVSEPSSRAGDNLPGAFSRYTPYLIPHSTAASSTSSRITPTMTHHRHESSERNSPTRSISSSSISPRSPRHTVASPSSRHGGPLHMNPNQELHSLQRSVKATAEEQSLKGHSPRTNKFSIESLTAKD